MKELVEVTLHGVLAEEVGKQYRLDVSSVGEAIHAINCLTGNKLYKTLIAKEKDNLRYQVLVNNEAVIIPIEEQKKIINDFSICELNLNDPSIRTIDIVPVIEGGDQGTLAIVLGVVLVVVGIVLLVAGGSGAFLIVAGIGLIAAGIIYMLSEPPKFEDFRSGKRKYLFEGPDNITGEGGPVPLLYGRLIVGSQVIAGYLDADYSVRESENDDYFQIVETDQNSGYVQLVDENGHSIPVGTAFSPKQKAVVYDLVSEGPIEGPVGHEYKYQGTVGRVGFDSVIKSPYAVNPNLPSQPWLRSVIYNEVPALAMDGNANFQQMKVSYSPGGPDGQLLGNATDRNHRDNELRITRPLNERLWYNDPKKNANVKIFRLLNTQVKTIRITWKMPAYFRGTKTGTYEPGANLLANIYYRPIYNFGGDSYSKVRITGPGQDPEITDPQFTVRKINFSGLVTVSPLTWTTVIELRVPADLKKFLIGWEVKAERLTQEIVGNSQAPLYLDSITEVYSDVYSMPNSAVFRNEFLADYFSAIPKRSYDLRGLKIQVPRNYDPITKQYTASLQHADGTTQEWDGTFQDINAWTDNPAWCFYDLITNRRYGLGKWISASQVDKWTLYLVGKYCDTMVPDGFGSVEPRFTCNTYIISREQAYKVLNDFASIFNAIVYYGYGMVQVVQDTLKDDETQFTNSNVEDGNFVYSSSSRKARHTVAMVRYNDPKNFFRPSTEYVEDVSSIQRYGYREIDLTAYGCTSRGQAVRLGRWALLSESMETETVLFTAGLEGSYLRPGSIFKVYDQNRKTSNLQGRLTSITDTNPTTTVTLDKAISLENKDYRFSLITPSYYYDPLVVNEQSVQFLAPKDASGIRNSQLQTRIFNGSSITTANGRTSIPLTPALTSAVYDISSNANQVWLIEGVAPSTSISEIQTVLDPLFDYYRCIRIEEKDTLKYEIVGLQYNSGKFALIESGLNFERSFFEYGATPANPQGAAINSIHGSSRYKVDYSFVVPNVSGITNFWVYANAFPFTGTGIPDRKYLVDILPQEQRNSSFFPATTGLYHLRIYSYNSEGKIFSSSFASGTALLDVPTKPIESISITSLIVDSYTGTYGSDVDIIVSDDINPTFSWQLGSIGASKDLGSVQCRLTVRDPSSGIIPGGTILKEATGLSPSGRFDYTFDFLQNKNLVGGPYRNYSVVVEAYSETADPSYTSAGNIFRPGREEYGWITHPFGYAHILYMNPPITGITLTSGGFITGNYVSTGWVDAVGGLGFKFLSGNLPTGIVGGWAYFSTGMYSGDFAKTGNSIPRYEFEFNTSNHITKSFVVPGVVDDFRIGSGYSAISFYDSFDREHKRSNPYFYTGLDITNVVPVSRDGGFQNLFIASQVQFSDFRNKENFGALKVSGSGNSFDFVWVDNSGNSWIGSSYIG